MRYTILVPSLSDSCYCFDILPYGNFQRIDVPSVCIIQIYKAHVHRYDFEAFFYFSKRLYSLRSYRSKSELYGAIQKLLQEELNVDVQ